MIGISDNRKSRENGLLYDLQIRSPYSSGPLFLLPSRPASATAYTRYFKLLLSSITHTIADIRYRYPIDLRSSPLKTPSFLSRLSLCPVFSPLPSLPCLSPARSNARSKEPVVCGDESWSIRFGWVSEEEYRDENERRDIYVSQQMTTWTAIAWCFQRLVDCLWWTLW